MKALDEFESVLKSMIGEIEEYWDEDEQQTPPSTKEAYVMPQPKKAKAVERLRKVLDEMPELRKLKYDSTEFEKWLKRAEVAIKYIFGKNSDWAKEFSKAYSYMFSYLPIPNPMFSRAVPNSQYRKGYVRGLAPVESVLKSMIEEIEEYWDEDEQQSSGTSDPRPEKPPGTREIFIVHGHDGPAKDSVDSFLRQLELEPIILHERPNEGRTIIEKFERYADVGFAVVLLTPDDVGGPAGRDNDLKPRARQNVILELGFFLGKLGRKRVCPLVKGGVEIPSDYDGVVYIEMDEAEGWKTKLIRELKAAGFDVDANRATEVDPTKASPSS